MAREAPPIERPPEPRFDEMQHALTAVLEELRDLTPDERRRVLASVCCLYGIEIRRSDYE